MFDTKGFNFINVNPNQPEEETYDLPARTGKIKRVHIVDKLREIGFEPENVVLGDFDQIGEYTARKRRDPGSENYAKAGAFFKPNYERGILVYHLIKRYNIRSFLEIGTGRGYVTFCAAKAMHDCGVDDGTVLSVDPNFDEKFFKEMFLFECILFV